MFYVFSGIISLLLLAADQFSKAYVIEALPAWGDNASFIDGFIKFQRIDNDGGAWGLMAGHTWILLAVTVAIMVICFAMLIKNGLKNKLLFISICLILSGGIGNMIDRIFRGGKVVDFIKFDFDPLKSFPIFNIADIAVCVGAGLLVLYFVIDIFKERKAVKSVEANLTSNDEAPEENQ